MLGRQKQQLKFTDINILQTWESKSPSFPKTASPPVSLKADDIFRDELFADCYASCGRPSIPPSRLATCCSFTTGLPTGRRKTHFI